MTKLLHKALQWAARQVKGDSYILDPDIPFSALLGIAFRRFIALVRCLVSGVVISINPKKLVFLGPGTEIRNRNMIEFGIGVTIGKGTVIDGLSREGVRIGDRVSIGQYCVIEATGAITDLGKGFRI